MKQTGETAALTQAEMEALGKVNADMITLAMDLTTANQDYQKSRQLP